MDWINWDFINFYIEIQDAPLEESEFFKINNDEENGSDKLKTIITMELIKKIKEKVSVMESKITKNLLTLKGHLDEFQHITNEDFDIESQREQKKKLENDIENNQIAFEVVCGMTRLIKNFQNQNNFN